MSEKYRYNKHLYSAKNIRKLDPRMHVRKRPTMYVGGIGEEAMPHLIEEVLDSALSSVFVGKCDSINVRLQDDNYVTISDNDSIISEWIATSNYYEKTGKHGIDWIFAIVAQRPFERTYKFQIFGGLHGIGLATVNPLSSHLTAYISKQNQVWKRTYREGVGIGAQQKYVSATPQPDGVSITFQPDFTIFELNDFDYDWIRERCQTLAYLFPQVTISLTDERDGQQQSETFHYPDGIQAMVTDMNQGKSARHEVLYNREIVACTNCYGTNYDVIVEIALQYIDSDEINLHGYVNSVDTRDGGTHIEGFRHALMGYINGASPNPLSWEQVAQGLTAVVNILHPDPQFEGNVRYTIINPEVFNAVESVMYPLLTGANLRELRHSKSE